MSTKVLHIGEINAITTSYFNFICKNNDTNGHAFLCCGKNKPLKEKLGIRYVESDSFLSWLKKFYTETCEANKIILHGLFASKLIVLLFCCPWLLNKCYWFIWGGDLYRREFDNRNLKRHLLEFIRSRVISNIGYLVTYVHGDVELARQWYGAKGSYISCLMYPSNLCKHQRDIPKKQAAVNIQVGNSADPSNNHIEIFNILEKFKDGDIRIYVPLSYGDKNYAESIIENGYERFGEKFYPLTQFVTYEKYINFLNDVDIAIFNHRRQQAMGNTITLLGLGKTVYMRSNITSWSMFRSLDIKIFDIDGFSLNIIDEKEKLNNQLKLKEYFSEEKLTDQLALIFR